MTPYYFAYEDLLDDWNSATITPSSSTSTGSTGGTSTSDTSSSISNFDDPNFSVADFVVKSAVKGLKNTYVGIVGGNGQPKVSSIFYYCIVVCFCSIVELCIAMRS